MRSTIASRRPSAALVVAIVALFAALGGTGYAAATLSGRDIQKRSIPANRVVDNALGGGQINESKLGPVPVSQQALTAQTAASATEATHAKSADSATSAQDAQKLQGRDATAFLANSTRVVVAQVNVAMAAADTVTASCAANEKGIGGGGAWMIAGSDTPTELDAQLNSSFPLPSTGGTADITGWRASGVNRAGASTRPARLRDLRPEERRSRRPRGAKRPWPARGTSRSVGDPHGHRLAAAPQVDSAMAPQPLGCGAELSVRRVGDEQPARGVAAQRLQAGRDVRRVADGRVLDAALGADEARHHVAAVEADPGVERRVGEPLLHQPAVEAGSASSRISRAAASARAAWSCCGSGAPKTAITPSPW